MDDLRTRVHRLVRTASWHRRLLAGGLAAGAVALAIEAASPPAPEYVEVTVAAEDLPGGTTLSDDHLATARLPPDALPDEMLEDAAGRVLAGPVRAREPLTDRRVLGPDLVSGWGSGLVAAPVRLADAGAARYVRHGERIDVLGTTIDGAGRTGIIAADVPVLTRAPDDDGAEGALIMVAATPEQAAELASAAVTSRLSFTLAGT